MISSTNLNSKLITLFDLGISGDDFTSKLFPDGIWPFIIQLLSFIVLAIAAIYLFYKPVSKMLRERQEYVESNISEAEIANREARTRLDNLDQEIDEKRKEGQLIIDQARELGEQEKARIIGDATLEASRLIATAQNDIELSKEKALTEIHDEIVNVALEASKVVLGREINDDDHQRLIEDFIKDVE